MKIVVATRNNGKLKEFQRILSGYELLSLKDINFSWDIKEVGSTFCENALIKARFVHDMLLLPVVSDDSGIVVPALGNIPGIYSARFSGPNADDEKNNKKLLEMVKELPENKRSVYYFCCVAFCLKGRCYTFTGKVDGEITITPRGTKGFGYDPIFYVPQYGQTMAELSSEEKDRISHRGNALRSLKRFLDSISSGN